MLNQLREELRQDMLTTELKEELRTELLKTEAEVELELHTLMLDQLHIQPLTQLTLLTFQLPLQHIKQLAM